MNEPSTYTWKCPTCHADYRIRVGKSAPEQCPDCTKRHTEIVPAIAAATTCKGRPSDDQSQTVARQRSWGVADAILFLIALAAAGLSFLMAFAHILFGPPSQRFQSDNAYGATANAVESMLGRSLIPGIAMCAVLFMLSLTFARIGELKDEIRGLRDDLGRRSGNLN